MIRHRSRGLGCYTHLGLRQRSVLVFEGVLPNNWDIKTERSRPPIHEILIHSDVETLSVPRAVVTGFRIFLRPGDGHAQRVDSYSLWLGTFLRARIQEFTQKIRHHVTDMGCWHHSRELKRPSPLGLFGVGLGLSQIRIRGIRPWKNNGQKRDASGRRNWSGVALSSHFSSWG
jgi:hypothetical protein